MGRIDSDVVLQTIALSKRFGQRWAVNNLSLTVHRGEVFGFLGPNGAGKSTTIRMVLSLIRPTAGDVLLFGKPLRTHREEVLKRVGGLVESADFYTYLSGRRNLEIVGALRGGFTRREIDEVLDAVGLAHRADERVKTYSHGMKQRLGIAQALLGWPEFIVLDEPTTGLDPQGIKEVRQLIRHLSAERGITIFLSSHLLSEIEQTATSMAIINRGTLVVQGNVRELLEGGGRIVSISAIPIDKALEVVQSFPTVEDIHRNGETLEVRLPADAVASLNARLVESGVRVHALVPKRSLEDYFLTITQGASEIE
ncbi:MAG TPA: ABC transporter ATP-binding protein [Bacteroidota bacterium]|nr:ABC transporter ATP-binding protein [Bacteroidota bacterium]